MLEKRISVLPKLSLLVRTLGGLSGLESKRMAIQREMPIYHPYAGSARERQQGLMKPRAKRALEIHVHNNCRASIRPSQYMVRGNNRRWRLESRSQVVNERRMIKFYQQNHVRNNTDCQG